MLTIKTKDCVVPWVVYLISATLVGAIVGAFAGGVAGGVVTAVGGSLTMVKVVAGLLGFVVSLPFSFFLYCWSVRRFLLSKVETDSPGQGSKGPPPL